jgi:serine/threonine protein kinase
VLLGERYDTKADVFSFGMVIWELLTRTTPPDRFPGHKFAVDYTQLRKALPADAPEGLVNICIELTAWESDVRPPAKEAHEKLKNLHLTMSGVSPRMPEVIGVPLLQPTKSSDALKCGAVAGEMKATPAVRQV